MPDRRHELPSTEHPVLKVKRSYERPAVERPVMVAAVIQAVGRE
jgi:Rad3-related DNA helicase